MGLSLKIEGGLVLALKSVVSSQSEREALLWW